MTKAEAIAMLKRIQEPEEWEPQINQAAFEALDMAIKALEQEPCEDAIRRADAEALFRNARSKLNPSDYKTADEFNTRDLMLLNAEQFIHLLPSVRPQEPILDKIRAEIEAEYGNCDICEWYEDYDYEENDISEYQSVGTVSDILAIIDKYKAENGKMLICPECGLDVHSDYKKCPRCGAKVR